jgi:hypothetical protein
MYILHYTGKGIRMMAGISEYVILSEEEYSKEKIEDSTAPGFALEKQYDTDIDLDLSNLPLDRALHARIL